MILRSEVQGWIDRWIAIDRSTRRGGWWNRWRVRATIAGIYRDAGLVPPPRGRRIVVSSPIAGAIAAGLATAARWLVAHPETHRPLFRRAVTADDVARAVPAAARAIVERVLADQIDEAGRAPVVDRVVAEIVAAIARATQGGPGHWLPERMRPPVPPVVPLDEAPAAAAADGDLAGVVCAIRDDTMIEVRRAAREIEPWVFGGLHLASVRSAVQRSVTGADWDGPPLGSELCEFLVHAWGEWWDQQPRVEPERDAIIAGARGHGLPGVDFARWRRLEQLHARCGPVFLHAAFWIVAARPIANHRDPRGVLHRIGAPALRWSDGTRINMLCGVVVPRGFVRGQLRPSDIHGQPNVELRRVLIDLYDAGDRGRYLRDSGADVIDADLDDLGQPRRLLRLAMTGEDALVMVEVTNSTPEPDGTFKRYTLRVPPGITSCRNAVAWTFGLAPDDYRPVKET